VKVLLDTHTLLWHFFDDPQLSATADAVIAHPQSEVFVSAASYWELAIKLSSRKLKLQVSFLDFIQEAIIDNGFTILPVEPRHANELVALPYHHRDPFDRLLVAQAIVEAMDIVSIGPQFDAYPVRRIW